MAKRRVRYKPGDVFLIPCPSNKFAYGRILLDLHRLRNKTKVYEGAEDCTLAGPVAASGLLVTIFHYVGPKLDDSLRFSIKDLLRGAPFYVSHSQVYDATFPIIDSIPVCSQELDFPEGTMCHYKDKDTKMYSFEKGGVSVTPNT